MISPDIINIFACVIVFVTWKWKRYSLGWLVRYTAELMQQAALLRMTNCFWRKRKPSGWTSIATVTVIDVSAEVMLATKHEHAFLVLTLLLVALFIYLFFFDDSDAERKLLNKIKSLGLTAVNAASFRREQVEAFA